MPRIEVRSTNDGQTYHLASSDPETIGRWMAETLDRARPSAVAPAQVIFWPLPLPDGRPDFIESGPALYERHLIQSSGWHGVGELADLLMKMVMREVEAGGAPSLPEQV
jgi:hypothetical protein